MSTLKTILFSGLLLLLFAPGISFSQSAGPKLKQKSSDMKPMQSLDKKSQLNNIKKNTKFFSKDSRGTWLLQEDFESGIFPPAGWTVQSGSTEWEQASVSGYGSGDYSMFYSSWNCNYSKNIIYTSGFSQTSSEDKLIFDYAYAPYDDGFTYYDNLEIFYYDDNDGEWYSLIYYNGIDLQTAPGTSDYYVPQSNEWGTKYIDIPPGATSLYFQVYENCSNNLYVDNIKVGIPASGGADASVEKVWAKGKLPLGYGVPDTISALIKNVGVSTMLNLTVYLNVSGANNFSDSLVIPSIAAGDTMQVNFRGFTPILTGFSDVTVTLPNDTNNSNNSGTYLTEVNSNTFRYVDSNCCNSEVGWIGELSFLNKYRMSGTGQIRKVNIKIGTAGTTENMNVGQIVYGIVLDKNGIIVGKSSHYKIKASDLEKYTTFEITDPKPFIATNEYFYVGIAQTEFAGNGFVYTPQKMNGDAPARPNANYGSYLAPVGTSVPLFEFGREYGQNYAIEAVIGNQASVDGGIANLGLIYDQYFATSGFTPAGKVFNAGTGPVSFNVRRTITPGGYTSTKTITGLTAGSNATVTFDPWTFISGTTYTVRDSILTSDGNNSNNQMTNTITPRVAKELCVLWQQQEDRDSLVRSILADGRYANNFDTVRLNCTGSYRPWKILFVNFRHESNYSPWVRDSLKMFIDNSTAGNKKSLIVFGNAIAFNNDPQTSFPAPADSIFYRQYLKSRTISDNWPGEIPASENKFRGVGFFEGITQDSLSDPGTPELIKPTNGSLVAFKPRSVTGNNDSCNAVSFAGANYNTFFMTNKFSSLRSTNGSPLSLGPVRVYTKIIDWLQSISSSVKVLDLTVLREGFYNSATNSMIRDTFRVYLRSSISPYSKIDSAKAYLSAAGQASFVFNNALNGVGYYLQLKHRNGIETWSKTPQSFSSNHLTYDFTTDSAKAFGNNMKKQSVRWVTYGGDANQDHSVNLTDILAVYNSATSFATGYVLTDMNGDNSANLADILLTYNNATLFVVRKMPTADPEIFVKNMEEDNIQISHSDGSMDIMIDHEIYDRFKNEAQKQMKIPDQYIFEKGKGKKIVKGRHVIRKD